MSGVDNTARLLRWIKRYPGWWYLICTPGEEHMSLNMMQTMIRRLEKEGFYELIFVLLMVHRDHPIMENFFAFSHLDFLVRHWEGEPGKIVKDMIAHFE